MRSASRQSGNVLFLILIAVALFAALSYAVTKSSRGGNGDATNEKNALGASRILNFGTTLQASITRLTVTNGVPITGLFFNNDVYKFMDGNISFPAMGAPASPKLYVFHPAGGGVIPVTFTDLGAPCPACTAATSTSPGHASILWTNVPQIGTTTSDPTMLVIGLTQQACEAINTKLGFAVATAPVVTIPLIVFVGSTAPVATVAASGAGIASIRGKAEFCYQEAAGNQRYNFVRILAQN